MTRRTFGTILALAAVALTVGVVVSALKTAVRTNALPLQDASFIR